MDHFQGCGKEKPIFKYGACQKCFISWTMETENGKEWLEKNRLRKFKQNQREKTKEKRKKDRQMKIELMSTSQYWSNVFQIKFNEVIRIIDNGCGCICTRRTDGKMNAGHYVHAGVNKTISINAHNAFQQSMESNHYQSGDLLKYQDGIKNIFGTNYFNFVESLRKCPALHISKIELMEANKKLNEFKKELKHQEIFQLKSNERIELRNDLNQYLGLYPYEFMNYEPNKIY